MNSLPFDIFCSKHSDCEAPISVITEILSENDPLNFEKISNEFEVLGFKKVKDLARATLGKASSMKLCGDSLTLLYGAIEIYSEHLDNLLKSAKSEHQKRNFITTQKICKELLTHTPTDLNVILLNAESFFNCGNYEKCIDCLEIANNINPNCSEVLSNFALVYMKKSENDLAKEYLFKVCTIKPFCVDAWTDYADFLFKTNDLITAELAYERVLSLKPELYKVHNKYGKLLLKLNRIKEAKKHFKIANNCATECPDTLKNLADVYYLIGKFEKAISKYKKALEINPDLINAYFYLGMAHLKVTEFQNAANIFLKALELEPENVSVLRSLAVTYCFQENMLLCVEVYKKCLKLQPEAFNLNLELALIYLHNLQNYQEAVIYLKKCIQLNPNRIDLFKNLFVAYRKSNDHLNASDACMSIGDLYLESDDQENARNAFFCAILLNPRNAFGHWKVGLTMYNLGHLDLALTRYKHAIELKPTLANAYCDIAIIYEEYGISEKAIDYYKMAIQLQQPTHYNACLNLANILYRLNINLNDALTHYEKALEYDNTSVDVYIHMGNIYTELNRSKDALRCFYMAIQHDPHCLEAYMYIGSIQKDSDNFIEAIRAYEFVLKLKPDLPDVYCNLVRCLLTICDWSDYDAHVNKLQEIVNKQLNDDDMLSLLPHDALMFPLSIEVQTKIASKYAKNCVEKLKKSIEGPQQFVHPTSLISSNGNLRIGFVSTNFGKHPITTIMESLSSLYDYQVDIICYSISSNDNIPPWLNLFEGHKDLSQLKFIDAAKVINNDGIHILVDMSGYIKGAQTEIFALRPAPIQVSWLGCPSTSVTTFMDYLITDKICSPPELQHLYTEKWVYTNQTIFVGDHKQKFPNLRQRKVDNTNNIMHQGVYLNGNDVNDLVSVETTYIEVELEESVKSYYRSTFNLPENVVVFCNFSKLYKIDPFTFRMWLNILNNVPNSVLWLLHLSDIAENNLRTFADHLNFDTSRIIFADFIPKYQHLNRIQLADIYLDTHLCNGHIACLDAIWAGVPVITLPGDTYESRVTASQLTTLGIADTIAQNEENYIEIAIQLGLNKLALENIRKNIWEFKMHSDLFDINVYAKDIILILKNMWNN
ncbi:UDP-N-acetylglucosamine--peptide N-acetylglucosaminyltransferase 110 kDa subunit [Acyrthosiphon pisum]|uniref:protein O-GlcNAc transferase n=1 Tax=Acyrthosiphon pisum TaxID=7029 RepID=A0A8R1W3Z8_ACYPI|nr:UDP-N-acetylglucosamine--peptide N-acetylglucosaminyltransferase 110 kDa subunit [Acyrthosiphon pisum]XP_003241117.1 UDP-N-acetylglucosamine--peptide N-acetylglucosaminyltransferase 110 kDa subunit [Acyrthosiphon pisum]XP_003241118.1 UDP-N-acetylglucosamine--peptide N-acetylglucosaminyltransferase 110 kDa subunit [Acyrthosiphon pisum]|eukprot:XP_001952129.2 PREDICTED: UDP-N-acetylglucosamine--peptide N-acetylglucosaminyltransferase 110 kDa subunit [Acyrthosiphon pisum]